MYLLNTTPPPPKKKKKKNCRIIVFDFSWDDCNTQEKLATSLCKIYLLIIIVIITIIIFLFWGRGGGINKVHYGLCENGEWQGKYRPLYKSVPFTEKQPRRFKPGTLDALKK